jgi:hypothetical protein
MIFADVEFVAMPSGAAAAAALLPGQVPGNNRLKR